jgi:hypothetical protein
MTLQAIRRGIIAARLHRSAASRSLWPAKGLASVFDYAAASNRRAAMMPAPCLSAWLPARYFSNSAGRSRRGLFRASDRSARWLLALRPIPGLMWLFLLVLPWFIAIYARVGGQFPDDLR